MWPIRAKALATDLDIRTPFRAWKTSAFVATSLTLALSVSGFAQTLDTAKLDALLDRLAEKNMAMGNLVIAKDGNVLYDRAIGYGQINGAERKPLTEASRFRIASITKTYTAVMILQLVEEGKLKLTDTLDKFFPQVPNAQKITILQILSHRSGIPNISREEATWNPGEPVTKDQMLALIVQGAPEFEPDAKSSYSNSGYFLLGLIVEELTGKSFGEALEERINAKIGLADTYLATGRIDVNNGEALTYANNGNGWEHWNQGFETHPSIGFQLISTAGDMAQFIEALFDLQLISQQSLDQMLTIRDGEGLGIVPFEFAGKTLIGNSGGGDNYGAWLAYDPEGKLAISYATNAKVYPVAKIVSGVVDICYNRPFEIPALESIAVSPDILDNYVGIYSRPGAPKKWTVTREGGTLLVQPEGEDAIAVEATADNKFQLFNGIVTFEFDAAGNQMILKRGPLPMVFTKEQ